MPIHTVTKLGRTQKGGGVVYFDNRHERADMVLLGKTISPPLGAVIDTDMASKHTDNGTELWFLNGWKHAGEAPQATISPTPPPTTRVAPSSPQAPAVGYNDGERLTVSNWVAAAITSGAIADPVGLIVWASAALTALRHMTDVPTKSPIVEFDKDVGF